MSPVFRTAEGVGEACVAVAIAISADPVGHSTAAGAAVHPPRLPDVAFGYCHINIALFSAAGMFYAAGRAPAARLHPYSHVPLTAVSVLPVASTVPSAALYFSR